MYQKNTYFIYHKTLYLHPIVKPELITVIGKNGNNHEQREPLILYYIIYIYIYIIILYIILYYSPFFLLAGHECMGLGDRSLSSKEPGPIKQSTVTGDPELVQQSQMTVIIDPASGAAHCQIEQATVTGDQATGEEQGQIEQSTVTGEEPMVQSAGATGDFIMS